MVGGGTLLVVWPRVVVDCVGGSLRRNLHFFQFSEAMLHPWVHAQTHKEEACLLEILEYWVPRTGGLTGGFDLEEPQQTYSKS